MSHTITVANPVQAALLREELLGQISDGMWENSIQANKRVWSEGGTQVWALWCDATIRVDEDPTKHGVTFPTCAFNFTHKELLEVVGDRMLEIARRASGNPEYTFAEMRKQLSYLKRHVAAVKVA